MLCTAAEKCLSLCVAAGIEADGSAVGLCSCFGEEATGEATAALASALPDGADY